jgi:hypothetical protein
VIIRISKLGLVGIHVLNVVDSPPGRLLAVGGRDTNAAEYTKISPHARILPITLGLLEALHKLWNSTVEDFGHSLSKTLGAPEGTVGDIDVDGEGLLEIVIEDRAKGSKDTFEGLDTSTEIEALLSTLEERLLDLGVLLRRPLTHDVVEEADCLNRLWAPCSLTSKEGVKGVKVDLASVTQVDGVLVAALTGLSGAPFLVVEIDSDTSVVPIETLARPEKRVSAARELHNDEGVLPGKFIAIPDPEVGRLTQSCLDALGVEDLLQQDTFGVVGGVAAEVNIILVNDGVRSLDNVERVEHDATLPAERVEVFGALRKRMRSCGLIVHVNTDIRMSGVVGRDVLVESRRIGTGHDEEDGEMVLIQVVYRW